MSRPFELSYDPYTQRVVVMDKAQTIRGVVDDIRNQLGIVSSALRKLRPTTTATSTTWSYTSSAISPYDVPRTGP